MKKIIFVSVVLFCFASNALGVSYRGCDSSEVARMKALVNNINISYDYEMIDRPIFTITVNNMTSEMYFVDSATNKEYRFSDGNNGEIIIGGYSSGSSGRYKFYSSNSNCSGLSLGSKYYNTPHYNNYYNDPLCEGLNISVCNKWGSVNYTRDEFENLINGHKEEEKEEIIKNIEKNRSFTDAMVDFYIKYYLYILLSIIVVCISIIFVSRKKDRFNI